MYDAKEFVNIGTTVIEEKLTDESTVWRQAKNRCESKLNERSDGVVRTD
jgi:hypothetical protein